MGCGDGERLITASDGMVPMFLELSTAIDDRAKPITEETEPAGDSATGDRPGSPRPQHDLTADVTFELLMNSRRRVALAYLDDHPSTTLSTLAEHIAARENDKPVDELTSAERKRVYISLYQCHLPKLDDAGVIDFDSDRGTVVRNPTADRLTPFLDRIAGRNGRVRDRPWEYYYLAFGLIGSGLLAAQLVLWPTLAITIATAGTVIAAFAGLALVHAQRR